MFLSLVDSVHEVTGFNFDEVLGMPVPDFFAYILYIRMKVDREKSRIDSFKKGQRII